VGLVADCGVGEAEEHEELVVDDVADEPDKHEEPCEHLDIAFGGVAEGPEEPNIQEGNVVGNDVSDEPDVHVDLVVCGVADAPAAGVAAKLEGPGWQASLVAGDGDEPDEHLALEVGVMDGHDPAGHVLIQAGGRTPSSQSRSEPRNNRPRNRTTTRAPTDDR